MGWSGCHSLRGSVDWNSMQASEFTISVSHSLRGSVDWNAFIGWDPNKRSVTPFAGVWIEIHRNQSISNSEKSHSLRGSVDWNCKICEHRAFRESHSLRGSVDWNRNTEHHLYWTSLSLPSRECGLKFSWTLNASGVWTVTPFAGVWIEINKEIWNDDIVRSLPSRECGLKSWIAVKPAKKRPVTPFAGVWIEIWWMTRFPTQTRSLPSRECGLK